MTIADDLGRLIRTHDDEPDAAADELRTLAEKALPADQLGRFSWLVAHVIGERCNRWPEACELIAKATSGHASPAMPVLLNAAVCAHLAGDLLAGLAWERRMAQQGMRAEQAAVAVRAAALSFMLTRASAPAVAAGLRTVIDSIERWDDASAADALAGASLNNVVSALIEQDDEIVGLAEVRGAMVEGAAVARKRWQRAGTWVNRERADYLCALVFNRVGDHAKALDAAERGRQLIESSGSEDVDRAFLLLESAQALYGLSRHAEGAEHLSQAENLAQAWDDVSLKQWFDGKARPVRHLAGSR
ncbi:hypothetical protein [Burkholderia alba]|uniref:hypothetical protein n=1 Tax=Burkholderia alba TaxID=2683677 RepID=UPI002B0606A2|nr:hypothetical protein [Burkholderia alba]